MISNHTDDLFICGRCRTDFTDLNVFLSHRQSCNGQQSSNNYLVLNSPSSTLLEMELDAIIEDVSTTISSASNTLYESMQSELPSTNETSEFDLLFSQPVATNSVIHESFATDLGDQIKLPSAQTDMSQISTLECPVCDEQFDAAPVLENHVFEHSTYINNDEYNYSNLGIPNDESSSSYTDLADDSLLRPFECEKCTITFATNASLNNHKQIMHCLKPVFRCIHETCAQLFDKPVDYILHARVHSQKSYIGSRRSARINAYRHYRKRTYRCPICKKPFPTPEQMQYHLHNETHKFICQLCPAEFDSNNSYHNHIAKHSNLALYRCTICIESFQKRNDLSQHVVTQHKDLTNQKSCSTCKLTFKTTFHLNRHNVTKHSDVKPYKCSQDGCQQAFARKDKLKQHAAKHSASGGLFKCHACVKTFVRPEHLRDHDIVRHTHEYPFRCEVCRKGFLHKNQLYNHHKQRHSENQTANEFSGILTVNHDQTDQTFDIASEEFLLSTQ